MENFLQAWTTFFNQLFSGDATSALESLAGQLTEVWNTAPLAVGAAATIFALLVLIRVVASFRIGGYKRQINALKRERNDLQESLENANVANNNANSTSRKHEEARSALETQLQQSRAEVEQLTAENTTLSTANEGLETQVETLASRLESRDLGQDRETLERERKILDLERRLGEAEARPAAPTPAPIPTRPQPTLPTIETRPQVNREVITRAVTVCQTNLRAAQQIAGRGGHHDILTPLIDVNKELEVIKAATRG